MGTAIAPNMHVTLDYVLKDDKGKVLDDSSSSDGEPIDYVHGYGMLVPGLEAGLVGLKPGDEKEIVVGAAEGFGERDDELILEVAREDFPNPDKLKTGDEYVAESAEGDEVAMRVVEVKSDSVVVDANHPLAGLTLRYSVKVRAVRDATEDEIAQAAADLEEAEGHVHGPGCGHDEAGQLVTLGTQKKPSAPN